MSKESKETSPAKLDPMKAWREWFLQNERQWSESLANMMKDESVARAVGQEINASLYRQQMLTQSLAGPMAMMNMPTREDLVALSERIGRLEDAIARLEAAFVQASAGQAEKPPRTRKPPRKAKGEQ